MGPSLIPERSPENCHACTPKTYCVTSGVWYVLFSPKKLLQIHKAIKKIENMACIFVMLVEHYKKIEFIPRMSKKNFFRTDPSVLPERSPENEVNFWTYSE